MAEFSRRQVLGGASAAAASAATPELAAAPVITPPTSPEKTAAAAQLGSAIMGVADGTDFDGKIFNYLDLKYAPKHIMTLANARALLSKHFAQSSPQEVCEFLGVLPKNASKAGNFFHHHSLENIPVGHLNIGEYEKAVLGAFSVREHEHPGDDGQEKAKALFDATVDQLPVFYETLRAHEEITDDTTLREAYDIIVKKAKAASKEAFEAAHFYFPGAMANTFASIDNIRDIKKTRDYIEKKKQISGVL